MLLAAAKLFRKAQGSIGLASLTPTVRQVFEISGFTSIFPIYTNREEAVGGMK
ncbi:putative anti-sigma factor antagonist BtrV [compost metagenome]